MNRQSAHSAPFVLLTLAALFAASADAQPRELSAETSRDAGPAPTNASRALPTASAAPLFYELPADVLDGTEHRLELVVTENGIVKLRDVLAFTSGAESLFSRPAVELLGLESTLGVRRQEQSDPERVLISIYLDGVFRGAETFEALARRSYDLERHGLSPLNIKRLARRDAKHPLLTSAKLTAGECVSQCFWARFACDNNCLLIPPTQFCKTICDNKYSSCMNMCGCPVVTKTWTTTSYFYTQTSSLSLCLMHTSTWGKYYLQYKKILRTEHWQQVTNCNGELSNQLLSVVYSDTGLFCYSLDPVWLPVTCGVGYGSISNACIF